MKKNEKKQKRKTAPSFEAALRTGILPGYMQLWSQERLQAIKNLYEAITEKKDADSGKIVVAGVPCGGGKSSLLKGLAVMAAERMKNITTRLSAVVKHRSLDKTKTLVWFECYTNSGRSTSSRNYTYDRSADKWTYALDEQEVEVSENYVAEDFTNTYKNFLSMMDMIDSSISGIKEGWLS